MQKISNKNYNFKIIKSYLQKNNDTPTIWIGY